MFRLLLLLLLLRTRLAHWPLAAGVDGMAGLGRLAPGVDRYESHPDVRISDHIPVTASFTITLRHKSMAQRGVLSSPPPLGGSHIAASRATNGQAHNVVGVAQGDRDEAGGGERSGGGWDIEGPAARRRAYRARLVIFACTILFNTSMFAFLPAANKYVAIVTTRTLCQFFLCIAFSGYFFV